MNLFNIVGKGKVYFNRVSMYLGIMNFILILANFKQNYNIEIPVLLVIPLGLLFILIIGWIDYNFIMKHEITHSNKQNDIKKQLNRIERSLNKDWKDYRIETNEI